MRRKVISTLVFGLALTAYGDATLANEFGVARKTREFFCEGRTANIVGTHGSDTIVIYDNAKYSINDSAPIDFTPPAVVYGGNGHDQIIGSSSDDIICGNNGHDTVEGGDGNDRIYGQNGIDTLYGDAQDPANACVPDETAVPPVACDDYIVGGEGKDFLQGNDGRDVLEGDNGPDMIDGGLGADAITGGNGRDICTNDGADTITECEI